MKPLSTVDAQNMGAYKRLIFGIVFIDEVLQFPTPILKHPMMPHIG
jgi:hypothetical protein